MSSQHHQDMYYDTGASARSPGSNRHQHSNVHRTSSRQFEAYSQLPTGLYTAEDHAARYETNRFDRANSNMHSTFNNYDLPAAQTWNPSGFGGGMNGMSGLGAATGRIKQPSRQRGALPPTWLDPQPPMQSMSPFGSLGNGMGHGQMRADTMIPDPDEELIPTAIVIKNIPFAVKKEQLVQLMTELNLPLPYAFNYHFDNGVFRGLAFANFTTAEETGTVIDHLNHFELQGRKLRVEYKKMLPLAERERIEREKRERRGQLEEQHRPIPASVLQHPQSMSSISSAVRAHSPSPVSAQGAIPDVNLNDPQTLQFYSELLIFRDDPKREALIFPSSLSPPQRRTIHTLAHLMGLAHVSRGTAEQRQVHVYRAPQSANNMSPSLSQGSSALHPGGRALNRAATIDFSEARGSDPGNYSTLRGNPSTDLLNIPGSPGGAGISAMNLRAAKSFADLRSYTPSPVPSSASFPATHGANISRYGEYGAVSGAPNMPGMAPTAATNGMSHREDGLLVNGLSGMSLGSNIGSGTGNAREARSVFAYDRSEQQSFGGPIGSNRSFSAGFDEQSRDRSMPSRQPRGPAPERGQGFPSRRQNGHRQQNSDELNVTSGVEIVVE